MPGPLAITALDIAAWAVLFGARSLLPVLVGRLVQEAGIALIAVDSSGHDEAQRPGRDGWTEAAGVGSWVPAGSTGWELSVADNPGKPNRDPGLCCKLMPMSGIEKRMARYPQLYSPVEFAHQYRRLGLP